MWDQKENNITLWFQCETHITVEEVLIFSLWLKLALTPQLPGDK